jgi:hypothetical protein
MAPVLINISYTQCQRPRERILDFYTLKSLRIFSPHLIEISNWQQYLWTASLDRIWQSIDHVCIKTNHSDLFLVPRRIANLRGRISNGVFTRSRILPHDNVGSELSIKFMRTRPRSKSYLHSSRSQCRKPYLPPDTSVWAYRHVITGRRWTGPAPDIVGYGLHCGIRSKGEFPS